jgi:uncharacterized protein YkwD
MKSMNNSLTVQSMLRFSCFALTVAFVITASAQSPDEQRLVDLTNEARTHAGLKPVQWDAALAAAAHTHAELMAKQGQISHQFDGEPDVAQRASAAGAHFSTIAENVAQGRSPGQVHGAWMQSQEHHDNLMNANIDHIGVAMIPTRGTTYVVADFTRSVSALDSTQVESKIAAIVQSRSLTVTTDAGTIDGARKYCALEDGASADSLGLKAGFLMRWQNSDITQLPPQLESALSSGKFKQAAIGACPAKGSTAGSPVFSGYRVAVLLF